MDWTGKVNPVNGMDQKLPPEIAAGLDTTQPNLIERRKAWNKPAPGEYALPTEIWREVIARRQRYEEIKKKLVAGEVREVNDFITLNLDLRQFAQDVVQNCEGPDLLMALWQAITTITVLDPTGGSGAFIFAALNILEPLYEACLDRMEAFLAEWGEAGKKLHPNYHKKFTEVLARVDAHPNRRYFVLKSIILNNLYAVDIMEEAVEICKLRLFLKLAAQVEPDATRDNLGIEPLPDIDFNIRAGNTLVGYATKEEVQRCMKELGGGQMKLMGEDELGSFARFNTRCADVEQAFSKFRQLQTEGDGSVPYADKQELQKRLKALEDELNRHLASEYGVKVSDKVAYANWLKSHQPFHWFVQFYGILNGGGFDVIIGSPPYVEDKNVEGYSVSGYATQESGNLYAYVTERALVLLRQQCRLGVILPLASISLDGTRSFRELVTKTTSPVWYASFGFRPAKLFEGVNLRLTILLVTKAAASEPVFFSSKYVLWSHEEREHLFPKLAFHPSTRAPDGRFLKADEDSGVAVFRKVVAQKLRVQKFIEKKHGYKLSYHRSPLYWIRAMDFEPYFKSDTKERSVHHFRDLYFCDENHGKLVGALLNSTLFYFWFAAVGNCRNLTNEDITDMPLGDVAVTNVSEAAKLFATLMKDYEKNSEVTKRYNCEYQTFYPSLSKSILDEIDTVLAGHYGFTAAELDFILNYDIKYRLGRATETEED